MELLVHLGGQMNEFKFLLEIRGVGEEPKDVYQLL
jgi:hypothetical protein